MGKRICLSGNWKMFHSIRETTQFFSELKTERFSNIELRIFPSFLSLGTALKDSSSNISIGAQNFYTSGYGAYTGEVSLDMIEELGIKNILIGHSERRKLFKESDELINKKVLEAVKKDFVFTLCVGESLAERQAGTIEKVLKEQIEKALVDLDAEQMKQAIIAYEPIWAIGTGVSASSKEAQEAHQLIRSYLAESFGRKSAEIIPIQYGGSVKANNIESFLQEKDIDGALIGGASLKARDFLEIIERAASL